MEYFHGKQSQRLLRGVSDFDRNPRSLLEAPKSLIDEFGLPALSVSLNHSIPPIPKFNSKEITEYFTTHSFNSLNELVDFIKTTYQSDIDKLFAIFAWSALNIEYNVDQLVRRRQTRFALPLEDIFKTKKCVCQGYSDFFTGVSKLVGINILNDENSIQDDDKQKFEIYEYLNMAKAFGYDYLNPPATPKPDHASIIIKINGEIYLSDPTWACGSMSKEKTFEKKFDPTRFLIPICNTLHDHFPCTPTAKQVFPFEIEYKDFINCVKLKNDMLRCESHPNLMIMTPYNLLTLQFSIDCEVTDLSAKAYEQNKVGDWIECQGTDNFSFQSEFERILSKSSTRTRFKIHLNFQDGGLYKVIIFVNYAECVTYYVNFNISDSQNLPIQYRFQFPDKQQLFNLILPRNNLTILKRKTSKLIFEVDPETEKNLQIEFYKIGKIIYNKKEKVDDQNLVLEESSVFGDINQITKKYSLTFPHHGLYSITFLLKNSDNQQKEISQIFFNIENRETDAKSIKVPSEADAPLISHSKVERPITSKRRFKPKPKETSKIKAKRPKIEQIDYQMTQEDIQKIEEKRQIEMKKCKNTLLKRKMYLQDRVSPFQLKSERPPPITDKKKKSANHGTSHKGSVNMRPQHQSTQNHHHSNMPRKSQSPSKEKREKSPSKK